MLVQLIVLFALVCVLLAFGPIAALIVAVLLFVAVSLA